VAARARGPSAADRRLYVDTSAYLCLLLGEQGAESVVRAIDGAALVSSVLLVLESRRNVIRLAREGCLSADQCQECLERIEADVEHFELRDLTMDICLSSLIPVISTPRSLDLAHLRTAVWFHRERALDAFLTLDRAQAASARELGLPTGVRIDV
jgi:hypothetical protein